MRAPVPLSGSASGSVSTSGSSHPLLSPPQTNAVGQFAVPPMPAGGPGAAPVAAGSFPERSVASPAGGGVDGSLLAGLQSSQQNFQQCSSTSSEEEEEDEQHSSLSGSSSDGGGAGSSGGEEEGGGGGGEDEPGGASKKSKKSSDGVSAVGHPACLLHSWGVALRCLHTSIHTWTLSDCLHAMPFTADCSVRGPSFCPTVLCWTALVRVQ